MCGLEPGVDLTSVLWKQLIGRFESFFDRGLVT